MEIYPANQIGVVSFSGQMMDASLLIRRAIRYGITFFTVISDQLPKFRRSSILSVNIRSIRLPDIEAARHMG